MVAVGYDPRFGVSRLSVSVSSCHLMTTEGLCGSVTLGVLHLGKALLKLRLMDKADGARGVPARRNSMCRG